MCFQPLRISCARSLTNKFDPTSMPSPRNISTSERNASASTTHPPERLYGNDLSWDKKATHLDDRGSYFPIDALNDRGLPTFSAIGGTDLEMGMLASNASEEFIPRLTRLAGFEFGSGLHINPMPPEHAAQYLREVKVGS